MKHFPTSIFHFFQGNSDLETIVQNFLAEHEAVQARYIGLYPVIVSTWPCLRMEVFEN